MTESDLKRKKLLTPGPSIIPQTAQKGGMFGFKMDLKVSHKTKFTRIFNLLTQLNNRPI